MKEKLERSIILICATIGLSALLITFTLPIFNEVTEPLIDVYLKLLSYFTMQSNILVVIFLFIHGMFYKTFKANKSIHTAFTVYITITGLLYITLLSNVFHPVGLAKYSNVINHYFMPIIMLIHWFYFKSSKKLTLKNTLSWLVYPFIYAVAIIVRGTLVKFYPYPFVNVDKLGFVNVSINTIGLVLFFFIISCLFLLIDKKFKEKTNMDSKISKKTG